MSIGLLVCFGNIGGLIGSYIYVDREAPGYPTGYGTSLAFALAGIMAATLLEFLLQRSNAQRTRSEEEVRARYTDEEIARMGETGPLFNRKSQALGSYRHLITNTLPNTNLLFYSFNYLTLLFLYIFSFKRALSLFLIVCYLKRLC